jgi:hypothetical protein
MSWRGLSMHDAALAATKCHLRVTNETEIPGHIDAGGVTRSAKRSCATDQAVAPS